MPYVTSTSAVLEKKYYTTLALIEIVDGIKSYMYIDKGEIVLGSYSDLTQLITLFNLQS